MHLLKPLYNVIQCGIMSLKGSDVMPTSVVNIRIDDDLLKYLKKRAEKEHRTLSNMIISILLTEKECDENDGK